jgi:hypothetical protein
MRRTRKQILQPHKFLLSKSRENFGSAITKTLEAALLLSYETGMGDGLAVAQDIVNKLKQRNENV